MTVVSMDSTFDRIAHGDPDLIAGARKSLDDMLAVVVQEGGSDLHVTAGSPPTMRLHGSLYHLHGYDLLTPSDTALLMRSVVNEQQWETLRAHPRVRPGLQRRAACRVFGSTSTSSATPTVARSGSSRTRSSRWTRSACRRPVAQVCRPAPWPRAGDRPDRFGQDHHPRLAARPRQPHPLGPHRHHRGPDRVPARAQAVPGQPARGRSRTPTRSRWRSSTRCARTPTSSWSASCVTSRRRRPR